MVVSEVIVIAHHQHLHLQLFLKDGAHKVTGTHLSQSLGEIHHDDLVQVFLLEKCCLLVGQGQHLWLKVVLKHLQGMVGEGQHHSVKSSFVGLTHHLLNHELVSPMYAIESANRHHAGLHHVLSGIWLRWVNSQYLTFDIFHLKSFPSYLQSLQSSHLSSSPRKRFSTFT